MQRRHKKFKKSWDKWTVDCHLCGLILKRLLSVKLLPKPDERLHSWDKNQTVSADVSGHVLVIQLRSLQEKSWTRMIKIGFCNPFRFTDNMGNSCKHFAPNCSPDHAACWWWWRSHQQTFIWMNCFDSKRRDAALQGFWKHLEKRWKFGVKEESVRTTNWFINGFVLRVSGSQHPNFSNKTWQSKTIRGFSIAADLWSLSFGRCSKREHGSLREQTRISKTDCQHTKFTMQQKPEILASEAIIFMFMMSSSICRTLLSSNIFIQTVLSFFFLLKKVVFVLQLVAYLPSEHNEFSCFYAFYPVETKLSFSFRSSFHQTTKESHFLREKTDSWSSFTHFYLLSICRPVYSRASLQVFSLTWAAGQTGRRGGAWSVRRDLQRVVFLRQPLHEGPGLLEATAQKLSLVSGSLLPSLHLFTAQAEGLVASPQCLWRSKHKVRLSSFGLTQKFVQTLLPWLCSYAVILFTDRRDSIYHIWTCIYIC